MDSLTQFALGAAVGEAVLGKKLGNKAMLWGGICGTIPDLDVFIPMGNAVADFTYHRSFSHSLFVLVLLTPLIAWLGMKIHKHSSSMKRRWLMMVYLAFSTHVLLDSFTAYGTQIFWPFYTTPVSWSTIFIIDPLYTLPLIGGLIYVLFKRNSGTQTANLWGIGLSSLYLSWSVGVKLYVDNKVHNGLQEQGVEQYQLFTTPSPFNTLLWRGVARTSSGYYEVYYSILDEALPTENMFYSSEDSLLDRVTDDWSVSRLRWFSKGFYSVRNESELVVISDLRMGAEPNYAFQFAVAEIDEPQVNAIEVIQLTPERDFSILNKIWQRIWSSNVTI